MKTLIIDNYDSYTFNLYQMIGKINGEPPLVIFNDQLEWSALESLDFDNIVISPGPGTPEKPQDFGICQQVLEHTNVPLLGVCLGHQGLGYFYGGKVIHAPEVRHGRLSQIYHNNSSLFKDIPSPFVVVRYHSLLVADQLPDCLAKIAWSEDGLIMGLRHLDKPLWGVQFHPESICTEYGEKLLQNFQEITLEFWQNQGNRQKLPGKNYRNISQIPHGNLPLEPTSEWEITYKKLDIYPNSEQVFVHLFGELDNAFWLDSSQFEENLSRFSFMGDNRGENSLMVEYSCQNQELTITKNGEITQKKESIFDYLKREIDCRYCQTPELPFDFNTGFVGYLGYELKAECGGKLVHNSPIPDAVFILADRLIVFDHQAKNSYLVCLTKKSDQSRVEDWFIVTENQLKNLPDLPKIIPKNPPKPINFYLSRNHQNYLDDIAKCLQEITEGETYQVCLTNHLYTDLVPNPLEFYRTLRHLNPAPYATFFNLSSVKFGQFAIACSSPERFLRIDRHHCLETKPIKGTIKRGKTQVEDDQLRESLRHSEKDKAENLMIVDLLRNDLGKVCEIGTIHVPKLMAIESYATVHQLVSTIRGKLRPDLRAIDCVKMAFPGGSMTGAPKIRTMEIIDKLEQEARGIYSGTIGFLGLNGTADFNIVIRTAVIKEKTSIGIGGGIVALSDAQAEFEETLLKAQALIKAILITNYGQFDPNLYCLLDK